MDDQQLRITTEDGATVDLAPLAEAARGIRRNALQDAEHGRDFVVDKTGVAFTVMGMKIAVRTLYGEEAERAFSAAIKGPQ